MSSKEEKLSALAQVFVVQRLWTYEKAKSVQSQVKEIFGEEISLPGLFYYSPDNPKLPKKWRELGEQTRAKFISDTSNIPIAQKSYRLKILNSVLDRQLNQDERNQNPVEIRATVELASKESGDAFTNKRVIDLRDVSKLTDDELQSIVDSKG